jgi:hypothetical protein
MCRQSPLARSSSFHWIECRHPRVWVQCWVFGSIDSSSRSVLNQQATRSIRYFGIFFSGFFRKQLSLFFRIKILYPTCIHLVSDISRFLLLSMKCQLDSDKQNSPSTWGPYRWDSFAKNGFVLVRRSGGHGTRPYTLEGVGEVMVSVSVDDCLTSGLLPGDIVKDKRGNSGIVVGWYRNGLWFHWDTDKVCFFFVSIFCLRDFYIDFSFVCLFV